jgi:hypothetical protein
VLTPVERRKNRKSRKAAEQAEAEIAGAAATEYADIALHNRGPDGTIAMPSATEDEFAPALVGDGSGGSTSVGAASPSHAATATRPPTPQSSKKSTSAKHVANPNKVANPLDPEAAAAAAERKKIKRQLKKLKKQERKRRLEVAAAQDTEDGPDLPAPGAVEPEGTTPDLSQVVPEPVGTGPEAEPPAWAVAPEHDIGRTEPPSTAAPGGGVPAPGVNGTDDEYVEDDEDEDEEALERPPVTTASGAAGAVDRPPG